ncbi:hypothetical protein DHEL01_v207074 [Diaporthe helianthi]|uniref:Uncharacterized protein n=1 Tax=Diaporthe helianthi TaxID=158607 RepID=A0A2P5HWA6_DIAHE|nr:hypothetical protein DHEL01_v207074 [Diaporthe helianthi]
MSLEAAGMAFQQRARFTLLIEALEATAAPVRRPAPRSWDRPANSGSLEDRSLSNTVMAVEAEANRLRQSAESL